jgi:hypothetical protein
MQIISQNENEVLVMLESAEAKVLSDKNKQYHENLVYSFTPQQFEEVKTKINQKQPKTQPKGK